MAFPASSTRCPKREVGLQPHTKHPTSSTEAPRLVLRAELGGGTRDPPRAGLGDLLSSHHPVTGGGHRCEAPASRGHRRNLLGDTSSPGAPPVWRAWNEAPELTSQGFAPTAHQPERSAPISAPHLRAQALNRTCLGLGILTWETSSPN